MIISVGGTKAGDYQRDAPPALLHGPLVFFTPMFSEARPDLRVTLGGPPRAIRIIRSVSHLPEKSGIYHFLINLSSGMGEWYMKVVYNSFDS